MSIRNETAETKPRPITTGLKRVVAASMAGTVVEWYEFFLYAIAALLTYAGAAVVTLVAALLMRETNGIDLADVDQADREELAKAGAV
jgi:hypothetical protein